MTDTTTATQLVDASDDDLKAMGLPAAFTLEELQASFSDEEIERMNAGDDPLVKMPEKEAGGDPDEDGDGDGDDDKVDPAADGDDTVSGDAGGDAPDEPADPDPVYQPVDRSAAQAIVDSAAADRKALRAEWEDGNLTDEELDAKQEELDDKIAGAKADLKDADRRDAQALEEYASAWHGKVGAFMDAHPELRDQTPIPELQGDSYLALFDTALRNINTDARFASLSMDQRIEAGAKMVNAHVKNLTGKVAFDAAPEQSKKDAALAAAREKAKEQGKRPDPLQTLGDVTAASETETENSRFAAIDRADSALERERAFSRLSAEEQDAYLKGN